MEPDESIQIGSTKPVFTLRVASELSGVPLHSIRQYIDKGLILPYKTDTNRHLFSEVDIHRLTCITRFLHERGLNIAGIRSIYALIPCWSIKKCTTEQRMNCDAYHSITSPCWESSHKGRACLNDDCRNCEVYAIMEQCDGLKKYLHQNF